MDGQQQSSLTGRAKSLHLLHSHHHDSSRRRDSTHDSFHHHPSDPFSDLQDADYDSLSPALELRTVTDPLSTEQDTEQAPIAADEVDSHSHSHAVAATSSYTPAASNAYVVPETSVNPVVDATSSYTPTSVTASTSLLADIKPSTSWSPTAAPSPTTTSANVILSDLRNGTNAMPNTTSSLVISSSPLSSISSSLFNSTSLPSIVNTSSPTSSSFEASVLAKTTSLTWTSTVTQASSSTVRHLTTTTDFETEVTEYADSESTSLDTESPSDTSHFFSSSATETSSDGGAAVAFPTEGISPNTGAGAGTKAAAPPEALPPRQRVIIVGVVTSVAGVAFLVLLAMLALKYNKKRKDSGRSLLGIGHLGSTAPRTIAGGGESMAAVERPVVPAPASRFVGSGGDAPADGAEQRGFYRVAGRKLPPVLMTGGDGYSDPRGTMMSDDYDQSSHTLESGGGSSSRPLALGAPMRPVSGVPIMRSGPARTPVTQNPFADPPSSPGGQDDARDRSRFHEGI
ncbi:hypothetical protein CP532_3717 [Ophiocordyceps camponoti-leonardi (nom. inval.)]|nr:hypothetical protein CP532_3717 [Ophiocordyceps camponoti-leonardi (nom. inval.)]